MSKPLGSYDEMLLKRISSSGPGVYVEWATRRERMALQRMERRGLAQRKGYVLKVWTITQAGQRALNTKEYPDAP